MYDDRMTLIPMRRTPGDNCVFESETPTLWRWACVTVAVAAVAASGVRKKCSHNGQKRRNFRRGAQRIGRQSNEQDESIQPSADDEGDAKPMGF
jgi:hypothetical protein